MFDQFVLMHGAQHVISLSLLKKIVELLGTITSDPSLDKEVSAKVLKRVNYIFAIFGHHGDQSLKQNCLAVIYNCLIAADEDDAIDFAIKNKHLTQIYLQLIRGHEDHPLLSLAALECLEKLFAIGDVYQQGPEGGEGNFLVIYSSDHSGKEYLTRATTSGNTLVSCLAERLLEKYFN